MASRGRNNILAGGFVVTALLLGVWVSFKLSNRPAMSGMKRFVVKFSIADGATGLKDGSPVLLAGQQIGRVTKVEFAKGPDGAATAVNVQVQVRGDLTLYENAGVYLQLPLLGTLSSINISSAGTPNITAFAGTSPMIEDNETVPGHIAPPGFLAQAGFGAEQGAQLRAALASMQTTVDRIAKLIETGGPKVEGAINDAQNMLASLKTKLEEWSRSIDKTAANVEQASGRLDPMLADAGATVKDIREIVETNRQKLTEIIDHVDSLAGKIDQSTIDEINAAIKQGRDALTSFSVSLDKATEVIAEETPGIRRTLANLRLMSDQLKLTSIEVRSQPWRLLHAPTTKEMSSQVLYDATRAYAEAASDLRAASEALQATNGKPSDDVLDELSRAMSKYKTAESALMDKLIENDRK